MPDRFGRDERRLQQTALTQLSKHAESDTSVLLGTHEVRLRLEHGMVEAAAGWGTQQAARGLRVDTIGYCEWLVPSRRSVPVSVGPSHADEWTLALNAEKYLAASAIRIRGDDQPICGCSAHQEIRS